MKPSYSHIVVGAMFLCVVLVSCKDNRYFTVSRIKDAAKLATTETIVDKIVIGNEEKKILHIFTIGKARVVCYTQAVIKAGIDLKKITKDDIHISGKRIELQLPAVEIINFSYPFDKFKIDSTLLDNGIFARIDVEDMDEFYRKAEMDIRTQLPYLGITEATESKTRQMMEALLHSLGYEEIYISFRKGPLLAKVKPNELL